jgi:hypothetical protein
MTFSVDDSGVRAALERALGHGAPFAASELASVRELTVRNASSLAALARCPALERLAVVASAIEDLAPLAGLSSLAVLHVLACPLRDASALATSTSLTELQIDFTFLEDLAPLTKISTLARGRFLGNPFTPESWERDRPSLERTASVELGSRWTWDATRELWEKGFGVCYALLDNVQGVLVRPGIGAPETGGIDVTAASEHRMPLGRRDPATHFEKIREYCRQKGLPPITDFTSHRTFGKAREAREWIAAAPPEQRASMLAFVNHFPEATFYREDEEYFRRVGQRAGVEYPAQLAASRAVLAGAFPDEEARFYVRSLGPSPRADRATTIPYAVSYPTIYGGAERAELFREAVRVFPIAEWRETGHSFLGAKLGPNDGAIYEFGERDLQDARSEGRDPLASVRRVFASHAELLASITKYEREGGAVVVAKGGG